MDTIFNRTTLEQLPSITVKASVNYYKTFTSPNPDYNVSIFNTTDELVGTAIYAESPIFDRIYLFNIEVIQRFQRKGYATAFLLYLAQTYRHPITAVKELHGASGFWNSARKLSKVGVVVTEPLSVGDMNDESQRWQHLWHEAERLEKLILERLNILNEPWRIAVGRGLES
ncbi:GNAT family N-acetyltransferase [Nitrincola nitratireducens]|uniref:N-acetyltransferase domain-containing protein n=1 Tax=Nitrincola nitratireducens TaxID=1229521 RepID=W9VG84_9GAMM|nr:GNAT family N-acetyltransferase [Nitrincola nitratireducens]EXJ09675.1 hypothetical protein D791_03347 [Nitrincola nitratireducens]